MLYVNASADLEPSRVSLLRLPDKTVVKLADNIQRVVDEDEGSLTIKYVYDEVTFDLPEDRKGETVESIEENFSDWWFYGSEDHSDPTIEERVTNIEEILVAILEG